MIDEPSRDVVVLAGGVGAARFLEGVVQVVDPSRVTVIVNTGDDAEFYGLTVSPDVDIVLFTLAGIVEPSQGWGVRDDTFNALDMLDRLGRERWFLLGDRDLAVHIHRTELLRQGRTPSEVTDDLRRRLDLGVRILPMSDQPVRTTIRTPDGWLPFQEYFVKRRQQDEVLEIRYDGSSDALPAPGLLDAINDAAVVLISPSNPLVSVGTILSLPGIREALRSTDATIVGVSPIVGGATIKGPADRMMRGLGMEVSAVGVARAYADFLDVLVIDQQDADLAAGVEAEGVRAVVTDTIMRTLDVKRALAQVALEQARLP
ncbi:MAG TPA: 2-phospho-L-lactate transferase [Chloroflexota bacterium]|nr:2-phospho-L-lactate transferase [Chloroflexota bacterium]